MQFNQKIFFLILFILLKLTVVASQTFSPLTRDIRVDADPPASNGAYSPAIAINQKNTFMIVWADEIKSGLTKVYGRMYHPTGEALTNEFRIDQSTDDISSVSGRIGIDTDAAGNFYVVWEDSRKLRNYQIFARVYNPDGKALTNEFLIEDDPTTADIAREPSLAINKQDVLAVTWIRNSADVVVKFFKLSDQAAFSLLQPSIRIDQNTRKDPQGKDPRIACAPDGEFVITWIDNRYEYATQQGAPLVYARQFSPEGKILGNDFVIQAELPQRLIACSAPNVMIDYQKNLYFCWNDGRMHEKLNSNMIYSRAFSWEQKPITGDVPIARCIINDRPGITLSPDGGLQIIYSQFIDTMTDPGKTCSHIFAQAVTPGLTLIDDPIQIDQGGTVDVSTQFDVTMNAPGWLVTSWIQNSITDSVKFVQTGHVWFNVFAKAGIPAPFNLRATEIGTDSLAWSWEWFANSEYQMNFYLKNEANQIVSPQLPVGIRGWTETGLKPNQSITRNVFAARLELESLPSNTVRVYTRCTAPANVAADSIFETTVILTWNGSATRFSIERAGESAGQPGQWLRIIAWEDSLTALNFTDTRLTPATAYWYRVAGYNGDRLLSETSPPLRAVTAERAPLPPILFAGKVVSDSSILWTWQDQADNEAGFLLEDASGEMVGEKLPPNTTKFLETNLAGNQTFHRRVRTFGPTGKVSPPSGSDSVTTLASPPSAFTVTDSSETSIRLTWNSGNASAFQLQRAFSQNGAPANWQTLLTWNDQFSLTEFTDSGLNPNSGYWYQLHCYNKLGQLNSSGRQLQINTLSFVGPSNFRGIANSPTEIRWTWRDNSENETGYKILTAADEIISALLEANQTAWIETGLAPNQKYNRRVRVWLPNDSFFDSNTDSVFTLVFPPESLIVVDSTSTSAALAWIGNGATRFAVERARFNVNQSLIWEIIQDWTDQLRESRFEDTGLTPQTQYLYRVRGYNGGQMQTEPSNTVLVTTPTSVLEPPTNLYGQAVSSTQINWFWKDNSSQEIAYRFKNDLNQKIANDFPANTIQWAESGLKTNTRYARQVFAVNANNAESGGSNLTQRFTLAVPPTDLRVERLLTTTRLAWNGHGSSRFSVERANDIDGVHGQWVLIAQNLTDSTFNDVKLPDDRGYWFHLLAYNGDSIRTQPGTAVFLPPRPLVRGDLNEIAGLDFGDLDRLIQIVLRQGETPTEREVYSANFYDFDEVVNIHDIIALVDTLLRRPEVFKPNQQPAQLPPVQLVQQETRAAETRLELSLPGGADFRIVACEFTILNGSDWVIEVRASQADFNIAYFQTDGKFRLVACKLNSARSELPRLELRVTGQPGELALESALLVESGKPAIFLPVNSEKIFLNSEALPGSFLFHQNYPNPFNAQTEIRFFCPTAAKVTLEIYNLLGQKINTLLWHESIQGWKKVKWDATDVRGFSVPSGIYLCTLNFNEKKFTRKLILIR
jgi:hypothetical protein